MTTILTIKGNIDYGDYLVLREFGWREITPVFSKGQFFNRYRRDFDVEAPDGVRWETREVFEKYPSKRISIEHCGTGVNRNDEQRGS